MKLTERDIVVLRDLASSEIDRWHDGWARPMDVGGRDASHHSATLKKLARHGLAEQKERAGWCRPSYLYRVTVHGRIWLTNLDAHLARERLLKEATQGGDDGRSTD